MHKQQHHPYDNKTYEKGINSDTNKEILGNNEQGEHVDALNMRSVSMDGDNLAKKKIKGEDILYPLIDNRCNAPDPSTLTFDSYECMMAQEINGHIVEIWASTDPTEFPLIRIDGQIVLYSDDFPMDLNYPLQYDKNESCIGGEFYITNNNTPPMIFNVLDLMDNSAMTPGGECTEKYFSEFNPDAYALPPITVMHKPAFIQQVVGSTGYDYVIGTSGLCVGSYSYSYRLVDQEGERTIFAPISELIPVVRSNSSDWGPQYPHSKTYSSDPNIASSTPYGNHIRLRYENYNEYSFLELRRDSWYAGDAIGVPPVSQIIASIPILDGMNVLNLLDRAEAQYIGAQTLTLEEESQSFSSIRRAKSIRYFNQRLYLMNIGYNNRDINNEVTFVDVLGNTGFPAIHKIGKPGHKHVYNAAMYKSNMRGERTGFGVIIFDKDSNPSYAKEITGLENFEFKNRRDITSSDTEEISYFGTVRAANTNGVVTQTHEVFDHYDAVAKTNQDDERPDDPLFYQYKDEDVDGYGYFEMSPVRQGDSQSILHKGVNKEVKTTSGGPGTTYKPKGFGLDYYSMGLSFRGLATYPSDAEGFSVVQTDPARRVLAQGLGFYSLRPASALFGDDTQKETDAFWSYFPDLEHIAPDIAEDLINNPGSYKIQLVSPLGYFTEIYTHITEFESAIRKGVDMITYARILREDGDNILDQINPYVGDYSGIFSPEYPTDPDRYIAYGRYTNSISGDSPAFSGNANGNQLFPIESVIETTTNSTRQTYFKITVDDSVTGAIYNEAGMNSQPNASNDATNDGVNEWREPFYVINLVRDENNINPGITTQYRYTGNYIKFKSLVLESTGANNQSAVLVSERWEDCIPQLSGQTNGLSTYGALKRFVYVVDQNEIEQRWMNIQFESAPNQATILAGIAAAAPGPYNDPILTDGFDIYGVYKSTETSGDTDGVCRIFTLNFDAILGYETFSTVPSGSKVYVRYDNRIPVRVFGGDTYVNESIWSPIDNVYEKGGGPSNNDGGWLYPDNDFRMNSPFPLKSYVYTDTYPRWENTGAGLDPWNYDFTGDFQFCNSLKSDIAKIRQLTTVWTAETRINLSFMYNIESPDKAVSDQAFPLINYIPRPHKWGASDPADRSQFESDNNLSPNYFDAYGYEWNLWSYGGFRFTPQVNIDYSKRQTNQTFVTVPTVGFEEQLDFCTRIIWSLKRPSNAQNTPSVRTFLPQNYFDISDDTGEIKFAWSALSGDKGNNLYAMTDSGVCLLMVDKRLLYEINANELATTGSDVGGILNQLWIDKTIGMHDETWRSWAEYSNVLFFCNGISAYAFGNNELTEIARTGFFELLNRRFNPLILDGYGSRLSGGFNVLTKEYVMNVEAVVNEESEFSTLIYGTQQQSLQCQSSYNYDKYLYYKNHFFGMKGSGTYELGIGNQIDGQDMECYLTGVADANIIIDKEFIRIRVNSNSKPERIYFYKSYDDYKTNSFDSVVDATLIPLSIKNYFGYECYIPRSLFAPHYRNQGRLMIFKIVSTEDEEFLVTSTAVQYKGLK